MARHFHDMVARFVHGQADARALVQWRRLLGIDLIQGSGALARKHRGHIVRTGVVGGDDAVVARVLIGDGAEFVVVEH
jgi:hypothetical protein